VSVIGERYRPAMRSARVSTASRAIEVDVPERVLERVRGLIGRRSDRGLLLRARSVHTFGMTRPIHALLLDRDSTVVAVVRLPPSRLLLPRAGVRGILEAFDRPFAIGDVLTIEMMPEGTPR